MRARFLSAGVAVAALLVGLAPTTASATAATPGKYYLSLGDSLAFGYQAALAQSELAAGTYTPNNFPGYTYRYGQALQLIDPGLQVVDYGCPGETTVSFINGPCVYQEEVLGAGFPRALHDGYEGESQFAAALAFLATHVGMVSPITISLGVNDLFQSCFPGLSPSCIEGAIGNVIANLDEILFELRIAAPTAEIEVLQYYDPYYVVLGPEGDGLAVALDGGLAEAVSLSETGANLANAFPVFNPVSSGPAVEFRTVCRLTLMCSAGPPTLGSDIHPSNAGYRALATIFKQASGF